MTQIEQRFTENYGYLLKPPEQVPSDTDEGKIFVRSGDRAKMNKIGRNTSLEQALNLFVDDEATDLCLKPEEFMLRAMNNQIRIRIGDAMGSGAAREWQTPRKSGYGIRNIILDTSRSQAIPIIEETLDSIVRLFHNSTPDCLIITDKGVLLEASDMGISESILDRKGHFSLLKILEMVTTATKPSEIIVITDGILPMAETPKKILDRIKTLEEAKIKCKILVLTDGAERNIQSGFYRIPIVGNIIEIDLKRLIDFNNKDVAAMLASMPSVVSTYDEFVQQLEQNVVVKNIKNGLWGLPIISMTMFLLGTYLRESYDLPNSTATWTSAPPETVCRGSLLWGLQEWDSHNCGWNDMETSIYLRPSMIQNRSDFMHRGTDVRDSGIALVDISLVLFCLGILLRLGEKKIKNLIKRGLSKEMLIRLGSFEINRPNE